MFDKENRPTIGKSVEESANSGIESADSTADSAENPLKIGLWVRAFSHTVSYILGTGIVIEWPSRWSVYLYTQKVGSLSLLMSV